MKTILITGASSGIGKASAKYFAEKGWNVVATMRTPELETELVHQDRILVTQLDVSKPDTIQEAIEQALSRFGQIDVLLNNAGYGTLGLFEAASFEQIEKQFEVNVFGLMRVTKAVLPHMRNQGDGLIMNVSSLGGLVTFPVMSLYHATKFAVEGFSESLSYELASQNIRVKLIEPGVVDTEFSKKSMEFMVDPSLTSYQNYSEGIMQSIGQLADPQKSSTAEFVASAIYEAAIDPGDQLRYAVGQDANEMIQLRSLKGSEATMAIFR